MGDLCRAGGLCPRKSVRKGLWIKLPEDGYTKLSRPKVIGQDETGKNIWGSDTRIVTNAELKSLVEAYKTRDRETGDRHSGAEDDYRPSGLNRLAEKKAEVASRADADLVPVNEEELPFR